MDEVFFVGIREPSDLRRDILGCVKKIVNCLRRYENINALRAEKMEQILRLRKVQRELAFLNNKLKAIFPKTKLRALPPKRAIEVKDAVHARKVVLKHEADELAQLESELSAIERQLGSNKA